MIRAAGDLQGDIARVTGCTPVISHDAASPGTDAIIIGSVEKSALVKQLIDTSAIAGKWESFLIQTAANAWSSPAATSAAPSTASTISPSRSAFRPGIGGPTFRSAHQDALFVKPGRYIEGEPAVKYRGIFLNDEAPALSGWVKEKFGDLQPRLLREGLRAYCCA